ncbi:MAG: class I SAM-dependent methyltransferase [Candidatus Omnitrophica bacterium]|nr:class I SAM-dependent methyltransferase [Candidatus Omnitrophota bacterium]
MTRLSANAYDGRWKSYTDRSHRMFLERPALGDGQRVLDVGCGTGSLELKLLARWPGVRLTAVDACPEMVETARRKSALLPRVDWRVADAHSLPFPEESFDTVLSASAFHYFEIPQEALREIKRVLKPGGRFFFLDWSRDFWAMRLLDHWLTIRGRDYHRCYRETELKALLETAGLAVRTAERFKVGPLWGFVWMEAEKA